MIVKMAKIRVLGPSTRLSAVIRLLQEVGAVHIESAPGDIRRLQSEIPVLRHHVLDPESQQIRAVLEAMLEKVRKLLLVLPAIPERPVDDGGPALLPDDAGEDAFPAVNARLDAVASRAEALVAGRKSTRTSSPCSHGTTRS